MRVFLFLLVAIACLPRPAHALDPDKAFDHYARDTWGSDSGYPQGGMMGVSQDAAGYMWMTNRDGLVRFDGLRFTHFPARDETSGAPILTSKMLTGRDGHIWVGTEQGVAQLVDGALRPVPVAGPGSEAALRVVALMEDEDGTIFAGSTAGLGVLQLRDGVLVPVPGSPPVAMALARHQDRLWVGAPGGMFRQADDGSFEFLPLPAGMEREAVMGLVSDGEALVAGTSNGVLLWKGDDWEPVTTEGKALDGSYFAMLRDRDGNVWAGGTNWLLRLRGGTLVEAVRGTHENRIGQIVSLHEDREGSLWIGTQSFGITRVWNGWTRNWATRDALTDPVQALAADPDGKRIWVGTQSGLKLLADGVLAPLPYPDADPKVPVSSIHAGPDRILLGTGLGAMVVDRDGPQRGQVRPVPAFAGFEWPAYGFLEEADGTWMATYDGLYHHDGEQTQHFLEGAGLQYINHELLRTRSGRLLAAGDEGLFEKRGDRFERVGADAGLPPGLPVRALHELPSGMLVAGTLAGSLYVLHGNRWHLLDQSVGVPHNRATFITSHAGFLWVAGEHGVLRIPLEQIEAFVATRRERVDGEWIVSERVGPDSGLQHRCCQHSGMSDGVLQGDTLWLPSADGVLAIDTAEVVPNAVPPLVAIEQVQVGGEWRGGAAVAGGELPAESRELSFRFAVLSFQDPHSNGVQYRLRGYDRQWRDAADGVREAHYTHLPPGDFVFEVRGTNNSGVASSANATLAFSIRPRFVETPWFALLLGALAMLLVYAGFRVQRVRHERQRQALEALVKARTAELEASHRQLEEMNHNLEQATLTDPLTGLRNRRYIANQIPTDLAYYDRHLRDDGEDQVLLFALVDVDHFKSVNDRYGHRAGDLVLQQVAQVMKGMVRTGDYVVRWGGEEFLLVFRPMPQAQVAVLGNRLREALAHHRYDIGDGKILRITASIGLSEYPLFRRPDGESFGWESMVELADLAMYHVKTHGRNGWAAFRPAGNADMDTLLESLQADSDAVIARGEVEVAGSPRVEQQPA